MILDLSNATDTGAKMAERGERIKKLERKRERGYKADITCGTY